MSIRADVGDTIEKRREKAFLKALEELQRDVGRWGDYAEIVSHDQDSGLSEDDQLAMHALMDDIQDAVDQLLCAFEKLANLTGGNTEILMDYFKKINKSLRQVFEISEKPGPKG